MGTGTSGGVPVIACDCPTCTSDDPRDSRLRTAACVRWTDDTEQQRVVLIDAGPDLRVQALRHDLRRCDGIFITHNHVDHIFGLDETRRFNAAMNMAAIEVYAEPVTWDALRRVYKHVFDRASNVNNSFVATLNQYVIPEPEGDTGQRLVPQRAHARRTQGGAGVPIDIHGMRFTPIRFLHGRQPILGFRIEPVPGSGLADRIERTGGTGFPAAWCTDVSAIPTKSWQALAGVRTLALDGLRHRHHPTHMTLQQASAAAAEIGADRTLLIHVAHEVLAARDEAALPDGVRLAVDGLTLFADGSAAIETAPGNWQPYQWTPHPNALPVPEGLPPIETPKTEPPV